MIHTGISIKYFLEFAYGFDISLKFVGHFLGMAGMDGLRPFGFLSPHGLTSNKSLRKRNQKK